MITLSKVDGVLLKWFQEWSEYKQITTDKNCYYFAAEVFKLMELFSIYVPAVLFILMGFLVDAVFFLVSLIAFPVIWYVLRNDRVEMRRLANQTKKIPGASQAVRETSVVLTLAFSVLMMPLFYIAFTSSVWWLTALLTSVIIFLYLSPVHFYLLSCSPLPPDILEFRRREGRRNSETPALQSQTV